MKVTKKDGLFFTTVTWEGVPGAEGYRLYSAGVYRSRTFDKTRRSARFSKGADPYEVEAIAFTTLDRGSTAPVLPPPTTGILVAPKVANKDGASDARFCCVNQPGVVWLADHPLGPCYVDTRARYDKNGLHLGGRSDACTQLPTPGLTSAKEMDQRSPCDLPTVGNPANNTGSWQL